MEASGARGYRLEALVAHRALLREGTRVEASGLAGGRAGSKRSWLSVRSYGRGCGWKPRVLAGCFKASDPIIFGLCGKGYVEGVFAKYAGTVAKLGSTRRSPRCRPAS